MKKKSKLSKKARILIIAAVIIAIVAAVLIFGRKKASSASSSNTPLFVKEEVYENVIEVSGVVSAAQEQTLQALSAGTVVGVYVKQGDYVHKGDIIMQLDDSNEQYSLAKHDYDMATVAISGSRREYELMETQRKALVQKINERKVIATFDGIIADIDVAVGDSLNAKDSIGTLVDVSYLTAEVEVTETDVAKLQVNQNVILTFPAYKESKVNGYIVSWPAIGAVTSRGATIVKVKVRIDDYPETILPNFSFSGKIEISPSETYTLVSKYAVGRDNGQAYVVKARNNEKVNVTAIPYDRDYVRLIDCELANGEMLLPQSAGAKSGTASNSRNRSTDTAPSGGMGGMGAGGPPPGGF